MRTFDSREREFIFDHGWSVNDEGLLVIPKRDAKRLGKSIRYPGARTMVLPCNTGMTLIIEGKHFVVV